MKTSPQTRIALAVTNAIKLAGLVLGMHEGLTTSRPGPLLLAAFMMAGAQVSENVLLAFVDRFLEAPKEDDKE